MALFEKFTPPRSLLQAVNALTAEQKGQIQFLLKVRGNRLQEFRKIVEGLVLSLPDEDHAQVILMP